MMGALPSPIHKGGRPHAGGTLTSSREAWGMTPVLCDAQCKPWKPGDTQSRGYLMTAEICSQNTPLSSRRS
jgi:hypothetical protein